MSGLVSTPDFAEKARKWIEHDVTDPYSGVKECGCGCHRAMVDDGGCSLCSPHEPSDRTSARGDE